jgi:hypothetical protein
MIHTVFLASCLLATGGVRAPGGPGPASANHDSFTLPRVGMSTKGEVLRMWGKPASQRVDKDHTVCTWTRSRNTCVLTFNDKLDLLVDYKVVKP